MSTIRVRFNGEERALAAGLQVRSLLTAAQAGQVLSGELTVLDDQGREHGLGGALADGQTLTLVPRPRG